MKKYNYPKSRVKTVVDHLHNVDIADDFRWLEGDENGDLTPEVEQWTIAQNCFTRDVLDNLPGRKQLEDRLRPLLETTSISAPIFAGNRIFYSRREGSANQPTFYYADQISGKEKLLLDPNEIDPSGLTAISWIAPSHDGELVAYGSYKSGDENSELQILRTNDPVLLPERITGKVGDVYWLPDGTGFIYSKLADVDNPYSRQIRFHMLGSNPENDPIIFSQLSEGPLATTWGPMATLSHDGKWLILGYYTSTRSNDLWLADFADWQETGELKVKEVAVDADGSIYAEVIDNVAYIFSNDGAPNGCVYKAPAHDPCKKNWKVFVKESNDAVMLGWNIAADNMLLTYQQNASTVLKSINIKDHKVVDISLPGIGTAHVSASTERSDFFVHYQSFDCPVTIYHHDSPTASAKVWKKTEVPASTSGIKVSQKWFESLDGTSVSMFLVHSDQVELNGNNPTLIYGYGGFGISMTPSFSALLMPWLKDGGVYALVNLRGGGEYGDKWHSAGMLANKHKVFEDLEASAQWLIDNNYTCSDKLAIKGGSNGGLLTGAGLTRRPDLYKAVLCAVPLLDMLRFHKFLMAKFWAPEYGSAEDEQQFKYLLDYSPYHSIKKDVRYPAVLFTSGENDTRVHPMHARKMAAALQTNSGAADEVPILLWVDRESGHGQGKPLSIELTEKTDEWLFLRWQLGMLE